MNLKVSAAITVVVGAALDAVSNDMIDHKDFNFHGGIRRIIAAAGVGAIIAFAAWFKGSMITAQNIEKGIKQDNGQHPTEIK